MGTSSKLQNITVKKPLPPLVLEYLYFTYFYLNLKNLLEKLKPSSFLPPKKCLFFFEIKYNVNIKLMSWFIPNIEKVLYDSIKLSLLKSVKNKF